MRILSTTGALVALVLQSAVAAHTQSAASALDTLLPKASELCDKAPALKPQDGLASGPAVVLFRSREGSPWGLNYQITPLANPADVRVVLCITERVVTSSRRYTDGSAAYDRTWSIAVLKWPDGSLIAHQSRTGLAPYVKTGSGSGIGEAPVAELPGLLDHPAIRGRWRQPPLYVMAMSADRKLAAFSRPEMMVAQWEVDRGSEIRTVSIGKGPVGYAYALAFSPDGSILATTAEGPRDQRTERSSIAIWDTRSGQRLRVLDARRSVEVRGLAFSPDGQTLISSGAEVNIWQVSNGRNLRTIKIPKWATATALSPDGLPSWRGQAPVSARAS